MPQTAGSYLKEVRQRMQLGLREVQEVTAIIAAEEGNDEFHVSASRLTQIENEDSSPSAFKIFSLSAVYGIDFFDLLQRYGIDPDRTHHYRKHLHSEVTHPVSSGVYGFNTKITLPVRLDPSFRVEATQLVNRAVALWGEIPAAFLLDSNPRTHTYGLIGLSDRSMFPLLRPGALVMIDTNRRRVVRNGWTNEFERPIYFVELRDGYRCAWCQVDGQRLLVIPHPMSEAPTEILSLSNEAEVVGQVVGVAMRLIPATPASRDHGSKVSALQ